MNDLNGYDVEDLREGMSASFSKTITEADIVLFAGVSGDNNAVHTNEEFAASTAFGGRIAHGFLTASVISAAVANRLPGPGTVSTCSRPPRASARSRIPCSPKWSRLAAFEGSQPTPWSSTATRIQSPCLRRRTHA